MAQLVLVLSCGYVFGAQQQLRLLAIRGQACSATGFFLAAMRLLSAFLLQIILKLFNEVMVSFCAVCFLLFLPDSAAIKITVLMYCPFIIFVFDGAKMAGKKAFCNRINW